MSKCPECDEEARCEMCNSALALYSDGIKDERDRIIKILDAAMVEMVPVSGDPEDPKWRAHASGCKACRIALREALKQIKKG